MREPSLAETIDQLAEMLRSYSVVLWMADDYREATPRILVALRRGAAVPKELPKALNGFQIAVEWGSDLTPH